MAIYNKNNYYGANSTSPMKTPKGIVAVVPVTGVTTSNPSSIETGAYFEEISLNAATLTTSQYNDGNNPGLLLQPGIYDIQVGSQISTLAGTTLSFVVLFVGTSSGNTSSGADSTRNFLKISKSFTINSDVIVQSPIHRVTVTEPKRYYPKLYAAFSGGSGAVAANYITARRV